MHLRAQDLKVAQTAQLSEIKDGKLSDLRADRDEGRRIRKAAEEAVTEERREEAIRRLRQKENALELIEANKSQAEIRKLRQQEEEEEAQRIADFAEKKEAQLAERNKRVAQKFASKLERRQMLIDRQAELLNAIRSAADERELRQQRDLEREKDEAEAKKEERRAQHLIEIDRHRKAQLAKRVATKAIVQREKEVMQAVWRQRGEALLEEEVKEKEAQRTAADRNHRFLLMQMHERELQEALEKERDIEEGVQLQEALAQEHATYREYVNAVMSEYIRKGRNATIVQGAAQRMRNVKTA